MNRTRAFDDEAARQLLEQGNLKAAMEAIDVGLRFSVCGWLRKRMPALSSDDLAGIWSETICGIIQAIQRGQFDTTRPLIAWICRIAINKATDHLRRANTRARSRAEVTNILLRSRAYQGWFRLTDAERKEVVDVVRAAIETLPAKQRVVIQAYVDHFPESRQSWFLQKEVSRVLNEPQTLASVKRALQEGRRKVRSYLLSKGYGPEDGDAAS